MPESTKRILTDETGQEIVAALQGLQNVVDPNGTAVAVAAKLNNMTTSIVALPAGSTPTSALTVVDGHYHLTLNIPITAQDMIGATTEANGAGGLVPAPTTADVDKFLAGDGTYKAGGLPMVILKYGTSTWADFEAAYRNNVIVYCRASSNSNPGTGAQTRMAFMAYVNDETAPTEVEFQYYRSVSTHKDTQMGDEVYVYKLNKNTGWSVTKRYASVQQIVCTATGLKTTYNAGSNILTIADAD